MRAGVRHVRINPAYTSLSGRVKFARLYGLSAHAAAALSIGRRAMGLSERPPGTVHADQEGAAAAVLSVPLDGGGHVTLPAAVRMRKGPGGMRGRPGDGSRRIGKRRMRRTRGRAERLGPRRRAGFTCRPPG